MSAAFHIAPLAGQDRAAFSCGEPALDRYLHTQATQDIRRRVANCFVAIETASGQLAGFYTLAAAGIPLTDLPDDISRRLPRYPLVPAVRIGRLAVDLRFHGRGLGGALVADAARRTIAAPAAAFMIIVDAKHERAEAFYRHLGFTPLASQPGTLFLPVATAQKTLVSGNSPP